MTGFLRALVLLLSVAFGGQALAQETVWLQVEARPTEGEALERAEAFAARLADVNGFRMTTGWYAITLGPYSEAEAEARLTALRAQRAIPIDSYVTTGATYAARFFGGDVAGQSPAAPVTLDLAPGEESVGAARAGERALTRGEREEVQMALRAGGFYAGVIDADFGPGTRRAMGAWQVANGVEATGVLTTAQRDTLLTTYRDAVAALGLAPVEDEVAGIAATLPLGAVSFDRYEPPFAHYEGAADGPRVLLISQTGGQASLAALYEVLQTLEIMPEDGPRRLNRRDFTLAGADESVASHAYATLAGDAVKGFVLVWPTGEAYARRLALTALETSFRATDGVLPDSLGGPQSRDLLAGLAIRRPERALSGFFVSPDGRVLTSASGVQSCNRLELGTGTEVTVGAMDAERDLALLEASKELRPLAHARLAPVEPRLRSEIAVAGFSFGGALSQPTVTFGALEDVRGLDGDEGVHRLTVMAEDGDAGGPVFDAMGAVAGMLLPEARGARVLPRDVAFARDAEGLSGFLAANGVAPEVATAGGAAMAPEDLTRLAADMTVLVTCWN